MYVFLYAQTSERTFQSMVRLDGEYPFQLKFGMPPGENPIKHSAHMVSITPVEFLWAPMVVYAKRVQDCLSEDEIKLIRRALLSAQTTFIKVTESLDGSTSHKFNMPAKHQSLSVCFRMCDEEATNIKNERQHKHTFTMHMLKRHRPRCQLFSVFNFLSLNMVIDHAYASLLDSFDFLIFHVLSYLCARSQEAIDLVLL